MLDFAKVADWMWEEVTRERILYQDVAASEIVERFGEEYTYTNENGNIAIHKGVLAAFRKLSAKSVVWDRSERFWRMREDYDDSNSRSAQ